MSAEQNDDWNAVSVIQWLMREGRLLPDRDAMLAGLGDKMQAEGAPVARIRVAVRTLHPLVMAISATWKSASGVVPVIESQHGAEENPAYRGSPVEVIFTTGQPYRRRLEDPLGPEDPEVLHEFREQGLTDYYGRLLHMSSGPAGLFIVSSATPCGFSDADLEKINLIAGALSGLWHRVAFRRGAIRQCRLGRAD